MDVSQTQEAKPLRDENQRPRELVANPIFVVAGPNEFNTVLSFIKAYYEFDEIPFDEANIRAGLEVLLNNPELGLVILIRYGREDVGYAILTFSFDLEFGGREGTVTDFYLASKARGLRFGTRAIQFIESTCRNQGIKTLQLQVAHSNTQAQAFYRKLGFFFHDRIPLSKALI